MKSQFELSICLVTAPDVSICWSGQAIYNGTNCDVIDISPNEIKITGTRSGKVSLNQALTNTASTIYLQITKALTVYYLCTGAPMQIKTMSLKVNSKPTETETDFYQPFIKQLEAYQIMDICDLESVFSATDNAFLTALVYYIKGVKDSNFENLWKSFNSLYSIITPSDKEFEKLRGMRTFIELNSARFVQSLAYISNDTYEDIRKLRIREFILNNWENIDQTGSYVETVKRFSDVRIIQIFYDTLPYRVDFLRTEGKETSVRNHINTCLSQNRKVDVELLCFYILKYGYFIRNKYFHAEKADPYFILKGTSEMEEMQRLSNIFQHFLLDLIKCNSLYM